MGLANQTPDGPLNPGPVTVSGQEYSASAMVWATEMASIWSSPSMLVNKTDQRIEELFNMTGPNGDTAEIEVMERNTVTTGEAFSVQGQQSRLVRVVVGPVRGIHTELGDANKPRYTNPTKIAMREKQRAHRIAVEVELDVAKEMAEGGARGGICLSYSGTTGTTINGVTTPGVTRSNMPDIKLLTDLGADFDARAITGRKLCAAIDPDTSGSLSRTASVNAQFSTPAGQAGWRNGQLVNGSMFGAFEISQNPNLGTFDFTGVGSNITCSVAPSQGATSATLGIANGQQLKKGMKVAFHLGHSVNEIHGTPTARRAQFPVAADTATAGSTKVTQFGVPLYGDAPTAANRWRTTSKLPAAGEQGYLFEQNTSESTFLAAIRNKTVNRSLFFADKTTAFVMVKIELPSDDREEARQISPEGSGMSFNYVRYWVGDNIRTRTRIDGRWGQKVTEPEGIWVICTSPVTS